MKGAIVSLVSVALLVLTVSCLLTEDFSTPGTLRPSELMGLVDWGLTERESGEQAEGQTEEATVTIYSIDGDEVVYVQGFKAVWFDLTKYIDPTPGAGVQISIDVMSTEKVTMYFNVTINQDLIRSENEEVGTSWETVSVGFTIPKNLPTNPRLLLKIEIDGDAVFYIRNLRVLPSLPTSGGSGGSS